MISLQILDNSDSTFSLYSFILFTLTSFPLASSFCSIEERILHEALRAPTTFLYPTDRRFRSSTVNSTFSFATFFIASTISKTPYQNTQKFSQLCSAKFKFKSKTKIQPSKPKLRNKDYLIEHLGQHSVVTLKSQHGN